MDPRLRVSTSSSRRGGAQSVASAVGELVKGKLRQLALGCSVSLLLNMGEFESAFSEVTAPPLGMDANVHNSVQRDVSGDYIMSG